MTSDNEARGYAVHVSGTRAECLSIGGTLHGAATTNPPCATLPLIPGEPAEPAERINPRGISLVGSGLDWPPAARFDAEDGVGRLPAAYAWPLLHEVDRGWSWRNGGSDIKLHPADALAAIIADHVPLVGRATPDVAVVVPNTLSMAAQDRLLSALRRKRLCPVLLWRPIAAALRWLDHFGEALPLEPEVRDRPIGRIVAIHLGVDGFEADVLDLVPAEYAGRRWFLPARAKPAIPSEFAWPLAAVEHAASDGDGLGAAWCRLWHQPFTPDILQNATRREWDSPAALTRWRINRIGSAQDSSSQPCRASPERWIRRVFSAMESGTPPLGAIITGEFAEAAGIGDATEALPELLGRRLPGLLTISETVGVPGRLLLEGAALFLKRHLANEPTYLDTLPEIRTLAMRQGEPEWLALIDEDRFVMGGRTHKYEPEHQRYVLRADDHSLTLSVWQEGHETVRQVEREIRARRTHDVGVRLRVEIGAGQGNPRVEVLPAFPHDSIGQRVYLDWDHATDTNRTREQELDEVPRTNPPLEPRQASHACWAGCRAGLHRAIQDMDRKSPRLLNQLNELTAALRSPDNDMRQRTPPQHATAFGSDGNIISLAPHDGGTVDRFVASAEATLRASADDSLRRALIRCLGYMSCKSPTFLELLDHSLPTLNALDAWDRQPLLVACGNCLRDPNSIAIFSDVVAKRFEADIGGGVMDWLRALGRILRYRPDATQEIDSSQCERLASYCYLIASAQVRNARAAQFLYREATYCIAFLLRRRRFDDNYMDPNAKETRRIKEFMTDTAAKIERGKIDAIVGVVDPAHITRMIVDYIDRRGKGRLVVLE